MEHLLKTVSTFIKLMVFKTVLLFSLSFMFLFENPTVIISNIERATLRLCAIFGAGEQKTVED